MIKTVIQRTQAEIAHWLRLHWTLTDVGDHWNVLWEPIHALAAITGAHHSEGPHHFIRYGRLTKMITEAGFEIERAATTVAVPGGPAALVRFGEWLEGQTGAWLMPWIGLRHVLICRRKL